jgi:hypothetical protein
MTDPTHPSTGGSGSGTEGGIPHAESPQLLMADPAGGIPHAESPIPQAETADPE